MLLPIGSNLPFFRIPWMTIAWGVICCLLYFFVTRHDVALIQGSSSIDLSRSLTFALAVHPDHSNPFINYFSYQFVHGSLGHLISNLWYLLIFGWIVENALGSYQFLALSLIGGALAVIPELYVQQNYSTPIVGASGSIAFMMGMTALMFPLARIRLLFLLIPLPNMPSSFFIPIRYLVYFWLLLQISGLASQLYFEQKPVAYATHLTGFGLGAIVGLIIAIWKKTYSKSKRFEDVDLSGRELKRFYDSLKSFNAKNAEEAQQLLCDLSDKNPWTLRLQLQIFDLGVRYRQKRLCDHVMKNLGPILIALKKSKDIQRIESEYQIAFSDELPLSRAQRLQLSALQLRA